MVTDMVTDMVIGEWVYAAKLEKPPNLAKTCLTEVCFIEWCAFLLLSRLNLPVKRSPFIGHLQHKIQPRIHFITVKKFIKQTVFGFNKKSVKNSLFTV